MNKIDIESKGYLIGATEDIFYSSKIDNKMTLIKSYLFPLLFKFQLIIENIIDESLDHKVKIYSYNSSGICFHKFLLFVLLFILMNS